MLYKDYSVKMTLIYWLTNLETEKTKLSKHPLQTG
jgi:hypothetical protein